MSQNVECPNCGAGFSNEEPRCPYCGALNPSGAESAYMHELADLRDETDKLDDDVNHVLKAELRRSVKRIFLVAVIVIVALIGIALGVRAINEGAEQRELHDYKVREAFREQYFDEFDRLYDTGDDAALSTFVWSLTDDPGFDAIFSWKHVDYLEAYNDWEALKATEAELQENALALDDYAWAVKIAIRLGYPETLLRNQSYVLSKEEENRAAPYREYARHFLKETLQMSEDEALSFINECVDDRDGILDDVLERNLKQRLSAIGTF